MFIYYLLYNNMGADLQLHLIQGIGSTDYKCF